MYFITSFQIDLLLRKDIVTPYITNDNKRLDELQPPAVSIWNTLREYPTYCAEDVYFVCVVCKCIAGTPYYAFSSSLSSSI